MEKQEFIKQIEDNIEKWADDKRPDEHKKLISYCYDVMCSDEELARVSEALAETKEALKEANERIAELETFKTGFSRYYSENESLKKQVKAYKDIVKAQTVLIELK